MPPEVPRVVDEKATFADLFKGIYLKRTFCAWTIAFCTSFIGYGLITWLPSLFRTIYQLPLAAGPSERAHHQCHRPCRRTGLHVAD